MRRRGAMRDPSPESEVEVSTFVVRIDHWLDGRPPTEDDVFLAVQDAVGPDGRLGGCEVEQIEVAKS